MFGIKLYFNNDLRQERVLKRRTLEGLRQALSLVIKVERPDMALGFVDGEPAGTLNWTESYREYEFRAGTLDCEPESRQAAVEAFLDMAMTIAENESDTSEGESK